MPNVYKSEGEVFNLLRVKYPERQYALLSQVADATGAAQSRWADAIAFGLWPSRGLEIEGFEIKVSRSDWLSELNAPDKSAAIQRYCHRWWIVAGSRDIVRPDELPKTWGLIIPRGSGLETKVAAPLLKPKKVTRKFVVAVMRAHQYHQQGKRREILEELRREAQESARSWALHEAKRQIDQEVIELKQENQALKRQVTRANRMVEEYESLERTMGVPLRNWNMRRILEAVARNTLAHGADELKSALNKVKGSLEAFDQIPEKLEAFEEYVKAIDSEENT